MIAGDTIDRVTRFHGGDLPVVSVYLGLDADRRDLRSLATRVSSLLHEIRPMAKDSTLEREARLSVRGDVERIEAEMAEDRPNPGAIAIFSCSGRQFYEEVELPRRVRDRIAVDATPWVRPLLAVLDEFHRACVLVLDSQTAHLWELYQGEITEHGEIHQTQQLVDEPPLRKPDYGGWGGLEERGVHNRTGELAKKHFRRVAAALDDLHRRGRFDLLVIGGHDHELPVFQDFLPHSLRGSVVGTFSIDSNTATLADIRANASAIVDRHERAEEQRWVAELLEKEAAGGNAAVGLERCLWAGTVAAVQRLLVHDEATASGVVCDESGWLGEDGDTCPLCGGPTRTTEDVIDELAQVVIDTGGTVEHVLAETPLQEPLVAADLRFALPPLPGADA
jgi:peptide subunit release factor 1 (eRF1)